MTLLRPINNLFHANHAYANTDVNELCRNYKELRNEEWCLTTDAQDGIKLDKQVETQEIYYQDKFSARTLFHLNYNYIEVNSSLMSFNLSRCCIFTPFPWAKDENWFKDAIEYEQNYPGEKY